MSFDSPINKQILIYYFSGRATALQKQMIEEWVKEPENEELFFQCLQEFEADHAQYAADVPSAMAAFTARIENQVVAMPVEEPAQREASGFVVYRRRRTWLAAASVVMLVATSGWIFRNQIFNQTYSTGYGEKSAIVLNDGSHVTLNSNSSLSVARFGFGSSGRHVYLQGEASFSVVHTPDDKQFVVESNAGFKVEVLGTEFTVLAREKRNKVILTRGKVRVDYGELANGRKPFIMAPGDLVQVDKASHQVSVRRVAHPDVYSAWQRNRFVFENTSLAEIKDLLQDSYGLKINIQGDGIENQTVSGSFQATTANELLQALSIVLGVNMIRDNNNVLLIENAKRINPN